MRTVEQGIIRCLFVFFLLVSLPFIFQKSPGERVVLLTDDELDQEQTLGTSSGSVICYPYCVAQSFKPTLPILTRAEVRLIKFNDITSDVDLIIRDNLTGTDLTYASVASSSISSSFSWIEFDFPDIEVIPEKTYYIVCKTDGGDWPHSHLYKWSCSNSDPYPRGQAHCSIDGGISWQPDRTYAEKDQCFRTYGIKKEENHPPEKPERPQGPSSGEVENAYTYGTFSSDPNGDLLYYFFDWGDGDNGEWIGPYESGETVSASHTWNEQGNYTIRVKARDEHGVEGEWSDPFAVAIPLSHKINMYIQEIFKDWFHGIGNWLHILLFLTGNNFL